MFCPRLRQALDEPRADRVCCRAHDDGDGGRRSLGCGDGWRGDCQHRIWLELDKLMHELGQPTVVALSVTAIHDQIFALDVAEFNHPLQPIAIDRQARSRGHSRVEIGYTPNLAAMLRGRAAHDAGANQSSEEYPPPHSMTSSARASSPAGTVKPSVLAVLRLRTS